ncbi:MAG: tripartite tricarboxylate transporter TctB family protein [Candidatus Methylomirabilales bacterium]
MRRAELACALGLVAFAGIFAWYAQELPIGWVEGEGPGGGFFPFWLSVIMGTVAVAVGVQEFLRGSAPRLADKRFFAEGGLRQILLIAIPGLVMVTLIDVISTYLAAMIFLFYYTRGIGKHSWPIVILVSVAVPIGIFLLFEKFLLIPLPKGYLDKLFYVFY